MIAVTGQGEIYFYQIDQEGGPGVFQVKNVESF
jgi:hypothetical protein